MLENIPEYVGHKIRQYRRINKLTQKELGIKVGVKPNTISSYEKGINEPDQNMLFSLAKALGVSINDFFPPIGEKLYARTLSNNHEYPYYPVHISAGTPIDVNPITDVAMQIIPLPDTMMGKWAGSRDIYIMRVNGDSMNTIIPHNSLIAVKNVDISSLKNGDIVVYSNGHKYSVKRFYNDTVSKRIVFRPDSNDPSFVDDIIPYEDANDVIIHGKVVVYIVESN